MKRFVDICNTAHVSFKTVPSLRDLLMGEETISHLREVNLNDLLGRQPVIVNSNSVRQQLEGRVVMVTGAAGSIGSELCRQVLLHNPDKLICFDQNETGIFFLTRELLRCCGTTNLIMKVGDIGDSEAFQDLIREHKVKVILHAAAYKHVPVMESNVHAAVKNNVLALLKMLDIAENSNCEVLVMISSDKAVNPTNVMGATKRIGELILSSRPSCMRCVSVRFGNVLGSNGSVVPIFQEQLRKKQPITITHPDIRRFMMTTQEAVSLVLQAFVIGNHRDILVLDMGESVKILDLANTLIALSGKSAENTKIVFTGLREGEKFFEELFYQSEEILPSGFEKINRTQGQIKNWETLKNELECLNYSLHGTENEIRKAIKIIVPEYVWKEVNELSTPIF